MLRLIVVAQLLITLLSLGRLGLSMVLFSGAVLSAMYLLVSRKMPSGRYSKIQWADMPWLYDGIARMAAKLRINMPTIYIEDTYVPNAYSFGTSIVLSAGLFEVLSDVEILAVAAHEMGHIKNGDTILFPLVSYGRYLMLLVSVATAVLSHSTIVRYISLLLFVTYEVERRRFLRRREFKADDVAVRVLDTPYALKNALEELKYYEDVRERLARNTVLPSIEPSLERWEKTKSSWTYLMSTHPSYDERILRIMSIVESSKLLEALK
ncbi:M48 family metallopeptidase [Pyrococcus yayanosii]|uniref:Peptidase, M48 family n=1 Tax=Pyrococcus yayanosii (strain CH1 / JCM 16557) TaxID=529709 RepID=F8AHI0_PYRYC|nr:M48 family metalloprotease [Pyrococcus yayanosii]AEH24183.1 peptidase, M48 family [Pyrococcus yayanosii CH1]